MFYNYNNNNWGREAHPPIFLKTDLKIFFRYIFNIHNMTHSWFSHMYI